MRIISLLILIGFTCSCSIFQKKMSRKDYLSLELRKISANIKNCYSDYITDFKKENIPFMAYIDILQNGIVDSVRLESKKKIQKRLENCISYQIYSHRFRKSLNSKGVSVKQPFNLMLPED